MRLSLCVLAKGIQVSKTEECIFSFYQVQIIVTDFSKKTTTKPAVYEKLNRNVGIWPTIAGILMTAVSDDGLKGNG